MKDRLRSYGLYDRIGAEFFYSTIGVAVATYSDEAGLPPRDHGDTDQER